MAGRLEQDPNLESGRVSADATKLVIVSKIYMSQKWLVTPTVTL